MSEVTPALRFLEEYNISFKVQSYHYAPQKGHIGEQAAKALGAPDAQVFKTLAIKIDRQKPAFVAIPVAQKLDFKRAAAAFGGKNAKMMQAEEAHALTGFVSGGTTVFGSKTTLPVLLDKSMENFEEIWINAGAQGVLVCINPKELQKITQAQFLELAV